MTRTGREQNIPILLWICAAICTHLLFGGGADEVGRIHDDATYLARMASFARDRVRAQEQTFELSGIEGAPSPDAQPAPPPPPPPPPKRTPPKPEAKDTKKPEEKKPEPKPEEKKLAVVVKKDDPKPTPKTPPLKDARIAVRQHVQPKQDDNPNARFIGDEANKVDEETVATQTSHDRDDANPTPGGNHPGPNDHVGDSERTKIAESEEHAGEKNRAPGERGSEFQVQREPMPTNPGQVATPGPKMPAASGGDNRAPSATAASQPNQAEPAAAPAGAAPNVADSAAGNWSFNPTRPDAVASGASQEQASGAGNQAFATPRQGASTTWLGLGGHPGPGQVNLNLNQQGVIASVGQDELRKEREADGERRRSEHRGAWLASNFDHWRSAIENYVSSVKAGNQTSLNTARVPFATYLNGIHNRIHPIFADNFLGSLGRLPREHPLNDPKLITRLEIVVSQDGHLVKMGVVRTSGVTAFDIAALDSVQRASPFGPAPAAIVSADGNVYLHWEFHRDEVFACSTMNASPYLLSTPPGGGAPTKEPQPPGQAPPPSQERGVPELTPPTESRQGARELPVGPPPT